MSGIVRFQKRIKIGYTKDERFDFCTILEPTEAKPNVKNEDELYVN